MVLLLVGKFVVLWTLITDCSQCYADNSTESQIISFNSSTNFVGANSSIDWCDPSLACDEGLIQNSMCYMTKTVQKGKCTFMEDLMTEENRRVLLAYHNSFRDQLASGGIPGWPPASDMRQLRWDDTLEKQATLWSFQCEPGLDPCPTNPTTPAVGQAVMNLTNKEIRFFDADQIFSAMINHSSPEIVNKGAVANGRFLPPPNAYTNFVQIAFARQSKVGCGLTGDANSLNEYTTKLTCFYAQETEKSSENALGYMEGPPCSRCPSLTGCNPKSSYKHLCSTPSDPLYDSYTIVFSIPLRTGEGSRPLPTALLFSSCFLFMFRK